MNKRWIYFVALIAVAGLMRFAHRPTHAAAMQQPVNTESGCATPSFTRADYPVIATPYAVTVGDFNRDGKDDVAVTNSGEESISVWLGDGSGKLTQREDVKVGRNPSALAAGDFDNDGKLDLAVGNSGSGTMSILLGNGVGQFADGAGSPFFVNGRAVAIASADFDLDGVLDLAVTFAGSNSLVVMRGTHGGDFETGVRIADLQTPEAVVAGDFNRDGKPDLAVAHQHLTLWLNNGNQAISFGAPTDINQPIANIASLTAADIDLDGNLDLAEGTNAAGAMFAVLWGNGAGGFRATPHFTTPVTRCTVAVGDFNVDGKPDVAALDSGGNALALAEGYVGWFGTPHRFTAAGRPRALAVADFNRDGNPDIVTANPDANALSVFLNGCGSNLCSGIGFAPTQYFDGLVPYGMAQADFNRDGILDLAVTDATTTNRVSLMIGNREGGFTRAQSYTAFGSPSAVVTADFNNDGSADLALGSLHGDKVTLLMSRADGGFAAPQALPLASLGRTRALAAADFNQDGKSDLAVAGYDTNRVLVLLGNGAGALTPARALLFTGMHPEFLVAADFNRDGTLDLAVASNDATVTRWLNDGANWLLGPSTFAIGGQPGALVASDLDRNGTIDLAVTNQDTQTITLLFSDNAGRLTRRDVASVPQPYALAVADFNRDGLLDLGVTSMGLNRVAVQRGDGVGNFVAPLYFNAGITPRSLVAADFNQDGTPDLASANTNSNTLTVLLNDCLTMTDLAVKVQSAEPYTFPNTRMDFDVTISNSGPDEAREAVITGDFSAPVTNARWTCQASLTAFCGAANGTGNLNATVTLPLGTTVTFRVSATAPPDAKDATGNISFNARLAAAAQATDPVTTNNTASDFTRIVSTPALIRLSPEGIVVGSGDFTLTVEGEAFYTSSVVRWNGENRPTTFVSSTRLLARIPAADINRIGRARVSVWTATPVFAETRTLDFIIAQPLTSVSAASFIGNQLAAESFVSAFGINLAKQTMTATTAQLPTLLGATSVHVRDSAGVLRAAPLFSISPGQINYVMPASAANGAAMVQVWENDTVVALGTVQIVTVAPGLFAANGNGQGVASAFTLRIKGDVLQSCEPVARYDDKTRRYVAVPIALGEADEQVYLVLSSTGIRHRSSLANVTAQIGGVAAEVEYAGDQGTLDGLDEVILLIPRSLAGRGDVFVNLLVDGLSSNAVSVNIQ